MTNFTIHLTLCLIFSRSWPILYIYIDKWKYIPYISVTHKVLKSCRSKMATLAHDLCDVHGASSLYIYKNLLAKFIQGFPYWGDGGVPPLTKNLLIHLLPTKFLFPPTKSQFNLIKKVIFSCSHCSCTIFVLISYSWNTDHANFDFNWCSVFTKCCF